MYKIKPKNTTVESVVVDKYTLSWLITRCLRDVVCVCVCVCVQVCIENLTDVDIAHCETWWEIGLFVHLDLDWTAHFALLLLSMCCAHIDSCACVQTHTNTHTTYYYYQLV